MNYPALKGVASCFTEPAPRGLTRSPQALIILFGPFRPYSKVLEDGWIEKCIVLKRIYVKGGSAFIPGLKTGVFPLRPLHPCKIKQAHSKNPVSRACPAMARSRRACSIQSALRSGIP